MRSVIVAARGAVAELIDHVGRPAVHGQAEFHDEIERLAIKDVGRVHDRGWLAVCRVAGGQSAAHFAGAHGIDDDAMPADQVEDRDVGARLLREADHIELLQVVDPLDDFCRIVNVRRRAETLDEFGDGDAGDLTGMGCELWVVSCG
jgi:hypothetical protein